MIHKSAPVRRAKHVLPNGEKISRFPSRVTPSYAFIARKTDTEKVEYIREILARDEEEALKVIEPVFGLIRNGVEIFNVYRPIIETIRDHFSRPGRPKAGQKTWSQVCEEYIGLGIRRVQQLLTAPKSTQNPPNFRKGDWRGLLKATEHRMSRVFGPLEDGEEFAEAIREFAQAIADRFGERHGRVFVSVSLRSRRRKVGGTSVSTLSPALPRPSNGTSGRASGPHGIAKFIKQNSGTDEEVAEACGVSLAVVRQAKVRHTLLLSNPVQDERNG